MSAASPRAFITETIARNPIVLFMKGVPAQPQCGFSATVVQLLNHLGAKFVGIDVLRDEALRQDIKVFSNWPTFPQLYVNGEFIGGADIVREMFQSGELKALLAGQDVLAS